MEKRIGDKVHKGDLLVKIMCDDSAKSQAAAEMINRAIALEDHPVDRLLLWQDFDTSVY
jgi:thymidine phosphorylase